MTTKEKIAILKKMRVHIIEEAREYWAAFCVAYCVALGIDVRANCSLLSTLEAVRELGLKKPAMMASESYWYPTGEKGKAIRIKKIDQLIKRLSKTKKP